MSRPKTLTEELAELLNKHSRENASNTPDWILADYLVECLKTFECFTLVRERWYGGNLAPAREGSPWRPNGSEETKSESA